MKNQHNKFTFILVIIWLLSLIGIATFARVMLVENAQPSKNNLGTCIKWQDERVCTSSFVGRTEASAGDLAKRLGLEYRVVERDEKGAAYSKDLVANRINVHVKDGNVVSAEFDRPPVQKHQ